MDARTRYSEAYDGLPRHPSQEASSDKFDLEYLFAAARRQLWTFVAACVVSLALGLAYVITAVPLYTASSDLLIDDRRPVNEPETIALTGVGFDTVAVDSQVEVVKSGRVAIAVVEGLQLDKNPRFLRSDGGILQVLGAAKSALKSLLVAGERDELREVDTDGAAKRDALNKLNDNLYVQRVARTHVLRIAYRSFDPNLAAQIANKFGEAYLSDQLNAKYDAARRASSWLQERIEELRQASVSTDLAVQKFRTEHNLLAPKGVLVTDQQLSELNSQLILARAESAKAEARYRRIRAILDAGQSDAAVSEALSNPVINKLRQSYLEASKREAEFTLQVGASHIQTVRVRNELREYERLIFDELKRIAESYESDYQVAKAREQNLNDSLSSAVSVSAGANVTQVSLRELEREAETYRNLHQTFLQRYQEVAQRQSFQLTEARVITQAAVPSEPSHPRTTLALVLSLMVGGVIGIGLGGLMEFRDRGFRTGDQVRADLGLEFFGMLPLVRAKRLRRSRTPLWQRLFGKSRKPSKPGLELSSSVMGHVLDAPLSQFAETLRSAKIAIDLSLVKRPKTIGLVSVLPGEGKSTVAMNLASLIAHQGSTVLLVDADMRNPGLTRAVAPRAKTGLVDALLDAKPLEELCVTEPESNLAILPAGPIRRVIHSSNLVSSPRMAEVLKKAQEKFDYVIVDLPPIGGVVDARAVAPMLEGFVLVVDWGRTIRSAVRSALASELGIREKLLGVILNKMDSNKLRHYETYGSMEYYADKFAGYYRDRK